MSETKLLLYQERPGEVPVLDWLRDLLTKNEAAFAKCVAALRLLRDFGHELTAKAARRLRRKWHLRATGKEEPNKLPRALLLPREKLCGARSRDNEGRQDSKDRTSPRESAKRPI